ncbi:MAG: phosphotransferase, partial [Myxococcota bacterium]
MTPPPEVLAAYPVLAGVTPEPIDSLINQTFRLRGARGSFILQRVHPVFSAAIHTNIEAVTRHLAGQAFPTPTLVPTVDGALCLDTKEGVWRVLTCIEGETHDRASGPQWLESAGDLVGRFHRALAELNHEFVGLRHGVHDTPAHLRTLESALAERADHRLFA